MNCTLDNIEFLINNLRRAKNPISKIDFAEPACLSIAGSFCATFNIPLQTYFSDNVLKYINLTQLYHSDRKPYYPLTQLIPSRWNSDQISNTIANTLIRDEEFADIAEAHDFKKYLWYIISETLNNVSDHSQSPSGCFIAAQFYPLFHKAQVAIADNGIGLLKTLSHRYTLANEKEAIFKAVEKDVTGSVKTPYSTGAYKNAGMGLYAIKTIIEKTAGKLMIISNDSLVLFEADRMTDRKLDTDWKGTLVSFELNNEGLEDEFEHFKKKYIWDFPEENIF